MDLSQFDSRKRAEEGVFVALADPYTSKPLAEKNSPGFMVRGVASRTVQSRLAEMQRAAKDDAGEDAEAAMERLHKTLIDAAMKYVIRPVNIEVEGQPVGEDEQSIRRVLDMTFPDMRIVRDEDGHAVQTKGRDKDGQEIDVPRFELANKPFAQQVIEAAEDSGRFFAKTSSG